MNRLNVSPMGN